MNKLKEGMYVRLQNDVENVIVINKIANIFDNTILTENDGSIYQGEYTKENIIKSSYNIIDLLEVGDYVNGSLIIEIRDYTDDNIKRIVTERSAIYCTAIREDELLNNLNSIVTKEQFESIKYEVGDSNE